MLQIAERVCTLRSLIDRECGIVGEVWKKYQKLIVGGGGGGGVGILGRAGKKQRF